MSDKPSFALQLSDQPSSDDLLDFKPYTNSLVDIVRDPNTKGPLVIGLFGSWGSGKTSLMRFVRAALPEPPKPSEDARKAKRKRPASGGFRTVWFDAWKYDKEEALWRALLMRVIDSLRVWEGDEDKTPDDLRTDIERLEQRLYRDVEWEEKGGLTVDWPQLVKDGAKGAVKLAFSCLPGASTLAEALKAAKGELGNVKDADGLLNAFHRDVVAHHQAQLRSLEQFDKEFGALVRKHIIKNGERLVVFVDDLDRCLPEKAIEVLEAIKLFLDVEGCIFLLGLDHEVVTRGIEAKYREFVVEEPDGEALRRRLLVKGAAYLEKIIQLPFRLPPIETQAMKNYVAKLATFEDVRCAEVFGKGLETNPRKVKRAINIFLFLSNLARHRDLPISQVRLAKIVVIYHSHGELYNLLRQNPALLRDIEASLVRVESEGAGKRLESGAPVEQSKAEPSFPVSQRLLTPDVREVLRLFSDEKVACFRDLNYAELSSYFTLTRGTVAEAPAVEKELAVRVSLAFPAPSFVPIPAGSFRMGTTDEDIAKLIRTTSWARKWKEEGNFAHEQPSHTVSLSAFQIGKYPVTNSEYAAFVKAGNRKAPSHWSGLEAPEALAAHPVANVDWDEAQAYCAWLTQEMRKGRVIDEDQVVRLPTEAEWEYAARGNDGRFWPWGSEWDAARCNSGESDLGSTTPVGQYSPDGDSPFGLADMAGNVWEWCGDWYADYSTDIAKDPPGPDSGSNRVMRGGSWNYPAESCRSASRYWDDPSGRYVNLGFRVVLARSSVQEQGERSGEREDQAAEGRDARSRRAARRRGAGSLE